MSEFHKWELVYEPPYGAHITHRMAVPGGWLYKVEVSSNEGHQVSISTCFVPHPLASKPKPTPREIPSRREKIIKVLKDAGKHLHVNVVSKATGIPCTAFASILRDEKIVKKNKQGRLHIFGYRKGGYSFLGLRGEDITNE